MSNKRTSTLRGSMAGAPGSGAGNPLAHDGELQSLMGQLDGVGTQDDFMKWKQSFVDRLEDFLGDKEGVEKARAENATVAGKMPRLDKAIDNLETNAIVDGQLKAGVKSQMAMNKIKEGCQDMEKRLTKLVPGNSSDIAACGYSKWHLGAVLVKDGFTIYEDMMHQEMALQTILPVLEEANVDRQTLEIIRNYFKCIRGLADVLADLGLFQVMMKQRALVPSERHANSKHLNKPTNGDGSSDGGPAPYVPANAMTPVAAAPAPAAPTTASDDGSDPPPPAKEGEESGGEPGTDTPEPAEGGVRDSPAPEAGSDASQQPPSPEEADAAGSDSVIVLPPPAADSDPTGTPSSAPEDAAAGPAPSTNEEDAPAAAVTTPATPASTDAAAAPPPAAATAAPSSPNNKKDTSTKPPDFWESKMEKPKAEKEAVAVPKIVKQHHEKQTINITTENVDADLTPAERAAKRKSSKMGKRGVRKCKSMDAAFDSDDEDDLPRTFKPTQKAVLPGSRGEGPKGRGVGRSLSKDEAKEKRMSNPYNKPNNKKKTAPKRSQSGPLPRGGKNQPPVGEALSDGEDAKSPSSGNPNDQHKDNGKAKGSGGGKKAPNGGAGGGPSGGGQPNAGGKGKQGGRKSQAGNQAPSNGPAGGPGKQKRASTTTTTNGGATNPSAGAKRVVQKVVVFVYDNIHDGKKVELQVDLTKDTLLDLKKQIEIKTKVPIDNQRIMGKLSGQVYEVDNKKVTFFGIKEETELDLDPLTITVKAKIMPQGGKTVPIQIKVNHTCNHVKDIICKETTLPPAEQELHYNNEEWTDVKKTVKVLGIKEGATITVEQFCKVPIKVILYDKKSLQLMVTLKKDGLPDIKQSLEQQTGIAVDNQTLFMPEDVELVEKKEKKLLGIGGKKDKKLASYGIEKDSTIWMEPKLLRVTVEMPNGESTKLKVTLKSDMSEIIRALIKTGMKAPKSGKQVLKFKGKEFPPGKTVKDMGLLDGSKVKLDLN